VSNPAPPSVDLARRPTRRRRRGLPGDFALTADRRPAGSRGGPGDRDAVPAPPPPLLLATADPSLARMLTFALDQVRLPHVLHTSGTAALKALLAMPATATLPIVILDIDLPGVDGHAILERLGVERPDTFLIVVLSSHADESVQVRSLLAGALDHLAKPFNVRVLVAKLQRWHAIASIARTAA
jgi:CheY-like chemotaxis protein